jgi:hypothetical protein
MRRYKDICIIGLAFTLLLGGLFAVQADAPDPDSPALAAGPAPEQPVLEQPAVEQPLAEQPLAEQPAVEQPAVEQPAVEQPAVEPPAVEQPAVEQPAVEQPAVEQPVAEQPASEPPVAEQPVAERPVAERPVAEQPVAEQPVAERPATERPAVEQPYVGQPYVLRGPPEEETGESAPEGDDSTFKLTGGVATVDHAGSHSTLAAGENSPLAANTLAELLEEAQAQALVGGSDISLFEFTDFRVVSIGQETSIVEILGVQLEVTRGTILEASFGSLVLTVRNGRVIAAVAPGGDFQTVKIINHGPNGMTTTTTVNLNQALKLGLNSGGAFIPQGSPPIDAQVSVSLGNGAGALTSSLPYSPPAEGDTDVGSVIEVALTAVLSQVESGNLPLTPAQSASLTQAANELHSSAQAQLTSAQASGDQTKIQEAQNQLNRANGLRNRANNAAPTTQTGGTGVVITIPLDGLDNTQPDQVPTGTVIGTTGSTSSGF